MNKELFLGLFAAFLGVCLQIAPTVFEFEDGLSDEDITLDVSLFELGKGVQRTQITLDPGEKKTVEFTGDSKDLAEVQVRWNRYPSAQAKNKITHFFIAQGGKAECVDTPFGSRGYMTMCFKLRPDLKGKTKFKITGDDASREYYQLQAVN